MREYLLVLCVAASVTYLLTPVARRFAVRIGAMAEPRDRDVHAIPTPRLGGLAMYAGICAAFLVAHSLPALSNVFKYSDVQAVVVAGGVIVALGLVDDTWGLDALTKLAGQVVAAGVMVLLGLQLLTITLPGLGALSLGPEGVPLTVLLALLTVNAVNFIDGLDGLAAGVGAIAALALFAFSYGLSSGRTIGLAQERISSPTLIAVVLAGACLGFLPHNFNPARVFMGDSGSMLIGLVLAASVTSLTGQFDYSNLPASAAFPVLLPLLLPLAVLAVPFVDLVLAVVRRTRAGRSPFSPDKAHLHHRLLEIGHSHTRAVLIMYFWTALLAFSGVAVSLAGPWQVLGVAGSIAVVALVASAVPRLRTPAAGVSSPLVTRNRTAALVTSAAGLVALVVGVVTTGSGGVLSAVVGTALVLFFFAAGALPLVVAGDGGPGTAGLGFLVLATTYALRLVVAIAVLTVATQSGAVDRRVMGLTVIGCALVWTATQVVLGARRRQPGLDL